MTSPVFVDLEAALQARRETAQKAYAWRRANAADETTRIVHDAAERADPVDEALVRWLIEEMARGTDPQVLPAVIATIVHASLETIAASSDMPREESWARFAATFSYLVRTDKGPAFSATVPGTPGGRA